MGRGHGLNAAELGEVGAALDAIVEPLALTAPNAERPMASTAAAANPVMRFSLMLCLSLTGERTRSPSISSVSA
jgi:hypothetical protein